MAGTPEDCWSGDMVFPWRVSWAQHLRGALPALTTPVSCGELEAHQSEGKTMAFMDLFRPNWKHSDPNVRQEAVAEQELHRQE